MVSASLPEVPDLTATKESVAKLTPPPGKSAALIFGPGRSIRIPTDRPDCSATMRMSRYLSSTRSTLSCAKLMRATSMPAPIIFSSTSGLSDAGPIVAIILVRLIPEPFGLSYISD